MLRKRVWFVSMLPWLIISSSGCHSWATVPTPRPSQPFPVSPASVHVVRRSGPPITLDSAVVQGDSLVGFVRGQPHTSPVAIALSDLSVVQVQKLSMPRTVGLVVLLVGLGFIAYVAYITGGFQVARD